MNRSSIYINLGEDASHSPSTEISSSKLAGDSPSSQQHHVNYYVEVIVPQSRVSHVTASGTDQKGSEDQQTPPATKDPGEKKKRRCGCWIWVYLIVVVVIVICLIVMFVLQCNFLNALRKEYEATKEDMHRFQGKSKQDADRNSEVMNDVTMKLAKIGPLFDETELRRIGGILNGTQTAAKIAAEWIKSHENLYYIPVLTNVTYEVAEAKCKSLKGYLASKILRKTVTRKEVDFFGQRTNITKLWAGYRRDSVSSPWRWADGGRTNDRSLKWKDASEPRNETGYNCAAIATRLIKLGRPTFIQAENCNNSLPYLCEIEPLSFL